MVQEIKVKVSMHCEKCRTEVMKAVTKLSNVDNITVDLEKQMLVVIGDVDPVCVATCLRKKKRFAEITSVGPVKTKETVASKKEDDKPAVTNTMYYYNYYNPPYYPGYCF
ncbi:heavy metal-associated isoprenylated plant protein 2-like [Rutidosis leptorrhynchoides]|uniref:heavy metal-associated isoprenylated plant protein 2-like n=1 Tax=Rutidosis leptorrhynchoides TaxID=125765 RepID=UPI003A997D8D